MKRSFLAIAGLGVFVVAGCGAARPPNQLIDARTAYQRAASDAAAPMVTEDLIEARKALDAAEKSFKSGGADDKTKTLAYVAQRRAIAVGAKADALKAIEDKKLALAEFEQFREQRAMAAARSQIERQKGELTRAQQEAESERQARAAADAKVQEVLVKIKDLKTAESERGLVLTISGSVLFPSGKSELLPTAQQRLGDVAKALKDDKRTFLVIGHTDSTGSDELNQRLSAKRADAVRKYLVSNGVDEGRIRSEGLGKSEPIADNSTPEGRANNRRVEIVIEKAPGSGEPTHQLQQQQQQPKKAKEQKKELKKEPAKEHKKEPVKKMKEPAKEPAKEQPHPSK